MNLKKNTLAVSILSALMVTACGGSGGGNGGSSTPADNWYQSTGEVDTAKIQTVKEVEIKEGCDVKAGTLIVDDNNFSTYNLLAWTDKGNLIDDAEWPGEEFTQNVLSCTDTIHYYKPATSMNGYSVIVNDGTAQTGDGNVFTPEKPCLKISSGDVGTSSFVSATECGVTVDGAKQEIPNDVIVYSGDDVVSDNDVIKIDEVAGVPDSAYTTLTLTLRGLGLDENATGKYWFGNDAASAVPFKNGEKIIIGKDVKVEDGASKEIKLSVAYTLPQNSEASVAEATDAAVADVVKVYTIKKTFSLKNDECRLNKQEETLGATYTKESTTFRIWSPDTSDVKVTVDDKTYTLNKSTLACYTNVYEATVDGDLAGKTYQFTIGGKNARDPYGKMTAKGSDTANIVMDMSTTEPEGGWAKTPALKNREDTIVYEVHVRDFTIDKSSGVDDEKRGRYLGMVQPGTTYADTGVKTGIDHLKELGVTHVQLQPIFDYATCSNVDSQDSSCYNWGYDPWNYNVPEDRYTSVFGTDNYAQKIKEVKEMINEFHKQGIRVIMDVVYNHTMDKTVLGSISQNYYISKGDDITGCGNTVNADQNMVWTMIRDSMDYWVSEFHVDGFRLDLVGAFATKDYSDWGEYLNKQHPNANLVIYGEPWASDNDTAEKLVKEPVRTGRMHKTSKDAHVGAFNNRIRNCLKGSSDDGKALGFIFNKLNDGWDGNGTDENDDDQLLKSNKECVFMGVKAGVRYADATGTDIWSAQGFADPEQTVSYITAHDNLALRDKIEAAGVASGSAEAKALQVYANSIIMISQGISFIHGGEEFGRTKIAAGKNKHNTYNTTTGANDFKWDLKAGEWKSVNDSYAAYIHMRKAHPAFRMTTADQIFKNVTLDDASSDEVVIVNIDGKSVGDSWEKIMVVMNSTSAPYDTTVPAGMVKVADGVTVGKVENNNTAAPQAVSIWAVVNDKTLEFTFEPTK